MENVLWDEIQEVLNKKFKILSYINLVSADLSPTTLDQMLKGFRDYTFNSNEKILIAHIDTQYYLPTCKFSITLYNLHQTLSTYGIPSESVIMFTNHYGIDEELKILAHAFNFLNPITAFVSFYDTVGTTKNVKSINLNHDSIEYLFCCINGTKRSHRILFLSMLKHHDLFSSGIVTINFKQNINNNNSNEVQLSSKINYLTLSNPTRINDTVRNDIDSQTIFDQYYSEFENTNITNELVYGGRNDSLTRWQPTFIQKSLIYTVTETVGDYPYPFLTEKTFKGILCKRPLLIAGAKNSLAMLRDLGFKTWNDFWDEDYDNKEYFYQRASSIISILKEYSTYDTNTLRSICIDMENVLEYNFEHYKNNFCKVDLDSFLKKIESLRV